MEHTQEAHPGIFLTQRVATSKLLENQNLWLILGQDFLRQFSGPKGPLDDLVESEIVNT